MLKAIFYLYPNKSFNSSVIQDAYVCTGLYQGQYKLDKEGNIKPSYELGGKLMSDIEETKNLTNLREKIKTSK